MLTDVRLDDQLAAVGPDPTRVLIAGAGVAGVTLAQLLRRQGLHPVLVERARPGAGAGYMIALFPLAEPVVAALGVQEEYVEASVPLRRYRIRDRNGELIREHSLSDLVAAIGDYRGLDRGSLLEVLSARGGAITHGTTVTGLRDEGAVVQVSLETGSTQRTADFDLLVAADGLHSGTRGLLLPAEQVETVDTGWGGWVAWIESDHEFDVAEELWSGGFFVGSYPVKGRIGVFVGGPRSRAQTDAGRFAAQIRSVITARSARLDRALEAISTGDAYFWSLTDCRSSTWTAGRTVLLGDAAAGFLPTAGIGAGMAMESAWVLGSLLDGVRREAVPHALDMFEREQRPRVESAQQNSRQLARLMFHESRALAFLRDQVARFLTLEVALGPIRKLMQSQPHPTPWRPVPTRRV
jgi:2-polyprenyl-6-methoxyphenol hydroxylase-like FAD-dependent oxidoreductase